MSPNGLIFHSICVLYLRNFYKVKYCGVDTPCCINSLPGAWLASEGQRARFSASKLPPSLASLSVSEECGWMESGSATFSAKCNILILSLLHVSLLLLLPSFLISKSYLHFIPEHDARSLLQMIYFLHSGSLRCLFLWVMHHGWSLLYILSLGWFK